MSVYSGFATRSQQKKYNEYLQLALSMLIKRIVKFYTQEICDEVRFISHIQQLCNKMNKLEQFKYMQPHFSYRLRQLLEQLEGVGRSRMRDDVTVHFDHELQASKNKVRFNTMEMMVKQYDETYARDTQPVSLKPIEQYQKHFKSRVKTQTPDKQTKLQYLTPQRPRHSYEQIANHEKVQLMSQNVFVHGSRAKQRDTPMIPKIEKPIDGYAKEKPMSPREFLRQTILGKNVNSSLPSYRAKQKYKKRQKV